MILLARNQIAPGVSARVQEQLRRAAAAARLDRRSANYDHAIFLIRRTLRACDDSYPSLVWYEFQTLPLAWAQPSQ